MFLRPPAPLRSSMMMMGLGPGGGGVPVPWTPLELGPLVWLDATQMAQSDGDGVAIFDDWSGNANHFIQANATKRPTFRATGINGRGAVQGDGVDDFMSLSAFGAQATWWGYIVVRTPTLSDASDDWWGIDNYDPDGQYLLLEKRGLEDLIAINHNIGVWTPIGLSIASNTDYALRILGSASVGSLRHDKTSSVSEIVGDASRADAPMRLFARGDGLFSTVLIGELIFGEGTLTTEQDAAVWEYLAAKWGTGVPP